nr:MAG: hypothetical protein ADFBMEEK_00094 [Peromyscus leucopus gammaherpesvirus]
MTNEGEVATVRFLNGTLYYWQARLSMVDVE